LGGLGFWRNVRRRGVHVNILKIGSRGGGFVFGGIQRFYAELRREIFWRNLNWVIFEGLLGVPRRVTEEGGQLVCILCV
jgi:hypothetical protein